MITLSTTENKVLMAQARQSLEGKWGLAMGTCVVYGLIIACIQQIPFIGGIIDLLTRGAISIGFAIFALTLSRRQEARLSQIFDGFQKFGVSLSAYLLQTLFILLWTLLFIIPGIIASLSYSMTFYIIAEDDSIGPREAISKSKEMMNGNKWKLVCLQFRFFGWTLLGILTLGIGFLWIFPYMMISGAQFYDDLKVINANADVEVQDTEKNPIDAALAG